MTLTDNEKKLIEEYGRIDDACEEIFLEIYNSDSYNERLDTICNLIKKIIIENLKLNNVNIDSNIKFDLDSVLEKISDNANSIVNLPNFNMRYTKDFDLLNNYFQKLLGDNATSEEIEDSKDRLSCYSLRPFLSSYIPNILDDLRYGSNEINLAILENNNPDADKYNFLDSLDEEEDVDFSDFNDNNKTDDLKNTISDDEEDFTDWDIPESNGNETVQESKVITNEELIDYVKFINTIPELMNCRVNLQKELNILQLKFQKKKLEEFHSNKEFMNDFEKIMKHNKKEHRYWFHGTQCLEDAYSIVEQGLGLMRDDISTTAYSEFSMDEAILYHRGFGGEIGEDAIVIIDMPKVNDNYQNIVEPKAANYNTNFNPSGLQGLNGTAKYIVNSKYIVGIIDKLDKKIIFNPNYYLYEQFNQVSEDSNTNESNTNNQKNNKHL